MMNITLTGEQRVLSNLQKVYKVQEVINSWLKSDEPDRIMQDSFSDNFSSSGRPSWARLSESTIASRQGLGFGSGPILQRTGNLMDEVTSMKGKSNLGTSASIKEWGIAQLRSSEQLKFYVHQKGSGKSGQNLPQRKMIGFQSEDATKIKDSIYKWIYTQLK